MNLSQPSGGPGLAQRLHKWAAGSGSHSEGQAATGSLGPFLSRLVTEDTIGEGALLAAGVMFLTVLNLEQTCSQHIWAARGFLEMLTLFPARPSPRRPNLWELAFPAPSQDSWPLSSMQIIFLYSLMRLWLLGIYRDLAKICEWMNACMNK